MNKSFKDIGRVAQTRKEKSAFKLISGHLLTQLEEDAVMAFNMVKKENVWAEIDVNQERERGVTAGAAYLKVKIRESAPTRPKDEKGSRATYVLFLEMLQKDLIECYNVKQIEDLRNKYSYLPMNEVIGYFLNPEFLTADEETKNRIEETLKQNKNFGLAFYYKGNYLVRKLVKEVFGAKFENAFFKLSDSASILWHDAKEKEPITEEESKVLVDELLDRKAKFIEANNKLIEQVKNFTTEQLLNDMNTKWSINSESKKVYKENPEAFREWIVSYYERRIRLEKENWDKKEKAVQPRDNDWSWFESPKTKTASETPKAKAINTKTPLAYIKRTGGYKIDINTPAEIVDKFGFKAVNYGVYVDDKWSREHTKHFLGAISDLAEMHNIDIKALNQLGKLSIAFGAKGRKGHLATYFPQTKDINLTKGNGDGSIAHEWGHYFDNVIVELDEQKATNRFASDGSMPDYEIKFLFKELMDFFYKGNELFTPKVPVNFYAKKADSAPAFSKHVNGSWQSLTIQIKPTIEETLEQVSHLFVVDPNIYTSQLRLIGYVIAEFGLESYRIPFKIKTSYFYHKSAYNWFQYCYKQEVKFGDSTTEKVQIVASNRTAYWTSAVELFARAWETVVLKKLIDKGRMSNYLVSDISIEDVISESWSNPYPSGKELEYIETMMDKIIVAVKKKFSIGDFISPSATIEDEYIDLTKEGKVEQEVIIDTKPTGEKEIEYVKEELSSEKTEAISTLEMLIDIGGSEEQVSEWKNTLEEIKISPNTRKMLFGGTVDYFGEYIDDSTYMWIIDDKKVLEFYRDKTRLKLSQVIKHENLFKKYPKIKNVIVKFGEIIEDDDIADSETWHAPKDYSKCIIEIKLNFKYYEKHGKEEFSLESNYPECSKESTLLHEIQHVSQQAGGRDVGRGHLEIHHEYMSYFKIGKGGSRESREITGKAASMRLYKNQPSEQEAMIAVLRWLDSKGLNYNTRGFIQWDEINRRIQEESQERNC